MDGWIIEPLFYQNVRLFGNLDGDNITFGTVITSHGQDNRTILHQQKMKGEAETLKRVRGKNKNQFQDKWNQFNWSELDFH